MVNIQNNLPLEAFKWSD